MIPVRSSLGDTRPKHPEKLCEALHSYHYSRRAEPTYRLWVKESIYYHNVRHDAVFAGLLYSTRIRVWDFVWINMNNVMQLKSEDMPQVNIAWNAVRAVLEKNFSFYTIKEIVGLAGFDVTSISHLEQRSGGGASKGQLMTGIDKGLSLLSVDDKKHLLNILIEEIVQRNPALAEELERYLERLGWQIIDGNVIPIEILDKLDLAELPHQAREDLIKATSRFRDGDLSGALSSACAAVDSVTAEIYTRLNLGDVGQTSFQERCKVAIKHTGVFKKIPGELRLLGWGEQHVKTLSSNFEGALNRAANVMQMLRSKMSDVHGTKPVLRPMVFNSIKWAEVLIRVMSDR